MSQFNDNLLKSKHINLTWLEMLQVMSMLD